ncbi:hypothetical protein HFN63_15165 [Rhizobium leguminosarum]|uniref:hypothetical protein n=1 Tax=Rhizobium leguminosarum TaxID=384 RepID=UPI001C93F47B|nr:hypothetical protein [Rhizobium leguminosarum]MBY5771443.1 hypothetical protein [Rhizobium leguminosarum]
MNTEATKKAYTTPYTFADWERGDARPDGFTIADAVRFGWTEKERGDFAMSEANTVCMYGFFMPQQARHLLDILGPGMNKFVYGKFLATEAVSVAVSLHDVDPTEVMISDGFAMAMGNDLCSDGSMRPVRKLKVVVWSEVIGEEEFIGRLQVIASACGYDIEAIEPDLAKRLFFMKPGAGPLKGKGDTRIRGHAIADLIYSLRDMDITPDVVVIDSASITARELLALGGVAYQMDWAIMVVDRGGDPAAMRDASFVTRTVRMMTRQEAEQTGIPKESGDRCMAFALH